MIILTGYETQQDIMVNENLIVTAEWKVVGQRPNGAELGYTVLSLGGQRTAIVAEEPADIIMMLHRSKKKGWL